MNITKEELLVEYNMIINNILDECDWVTHFTGEEVCSNICRALKNLNFEYLISRNELYEIYNTHVKSLNLTDEQWREQYGVTEIVYMIHYLISQHLKNLD
jgi:hypothetical protein